MLLAAATDTVKIILMDYDKDEPKIIMSPLCQRVTRDGISVDVEIFRAESDAVWILEVVDRLGGSTVFDTPFPTDHAALDAVLLLIEQEGIDTFLEDHAGTIH